MRNINEIQISPDNSNSYKEKSIPTYSNERLKENINQGRRRFLIGAATLALDLVLPTEVDKPESITKGMLEHLKSLLNRNKSDNTKKKQEIKKPEEKKESPRGMQLLAQEVQIRTHQLIKNKEFFPKELLSENFFLAVQIQESNLEKDAESQAGAIGIMQVRPITVREVIRYLNILRDAGTIKFEGPLAKDLSENNISELMDLIKKNRDLSRAFGKFYFAELLNNFEIGKRTFALGKIDQARRKILTAYNWNPDSFKKNENNESAWPLESRQYCDKVLANLSRLDSIQKEIKDLKMKTDSHDLSALLTMELNKYKDIDTENPSFKTMVRSYLEKINTIENIKERPLKRNEIENLISKFNHSVYRLYANLK